MGAGGRAIPAALAMVATVAVGVAAGGKAAAPATPSRPAWLKADDGPHTFTFDTVARRLPRIVRSALEAEDLPEEAAADLEALASDIESNAPIKPLSAPGLAYWNEYPLMKEALEGKETWFSAPWWLVENYLYKRILETLAARGVRGDPFAAQKRAALEGSAPFVHEGIAPLRAAAAAGGEAGFMAAVPFFVYGSLWGNRADLSLSAGVVAAAKGPAGSGPGPDPAAALSPEALARVRDEAHLLRDDTDALCDLLFSATTSTGTVALVLDNAGPELLHDLALADALLAAGACAQVELHCKDAPVFVSDVVEADVGETLAWLDTQGGGAEELARDVRARIAEGSIFLESSEKFYTSPEPFWRMPEGLRKRFARADVVLLKGDANYRRWLGDLHWAHDAPLEDAVGGGEWECPVAAIRTCKSEVLCGVARARTEAAAEARPADWLTAGQYGMVQLYVPDFDEEA